MLLRLHALGRRLHAQAVAQRGDRADDGHGFLILHQVTHKGLVDLDLVERKAAQVAERRVSGAEIIQRYGDPHGAQLMQRRQGAHGVLQQDRFRDLQLQPVRPQAGCVECFPHGGDKIAFLELNRRQVHGNADVGRPVLRLETGHSQHPLADRDDHPRLLGDGDKVQRGDQAADRVVPAQQRLKPGDLARGQIDQRLVVEFELISGDGVPEIQLQHPAYLYARIHLRLEEPDRAAALGLCQVQRDVGVLQQLHGRIAVAGRHGDPDTDSNRDLMPVDVERVTKCRDDTVREQQCVVGPLYGMLDNGELIPTQARNGVHFTRACRQPVRRGP